MAFLYQEAMLLPISEHEKGGVELFIASTVNAHLQNVPFLHSCKNNILCIFQFIVFSPLFMETYFCFMIFRIRFVWPPAYMLIPRLTSVPGFTLHLHKVFLTLQLRATRQRDICLALLTRPPLPILCLLKTAGSELFM